MSIYPFCPWSWKFPKESKGKLCATDANLRQYLTWPFCSDKLTVHVKFWFWTFVLSLENVKKSKIFHLKMMPEIKSFNKCLSVLVSSFLKLCGSYIIYTCISFLHVEYIVHMCFSFIRQTLAFHLAMFCLHCSVFILFYVLYLNHICH